MLCCDFTVVLLLSTAADDIYRDVHDRDPPQQQEGQSQDSQKGTNVLSTYSGSCI